MRIGIVGEGGGCLTAVSGQLQAAGHTVFRLHPQDAGSLRSLGLEAFVLWSTAADVTALELCRDLREGGNQLAILIVTSELDVEHARGAFDAGCDDYFVEPLRSEVVLARLTVLAQRRSVPAPWPDDVQVGPLRIDAYDRVLIGDERHKVPGKELALLRRLASAPGEIVAYEQLIAAGWGSERLGSNALEVHVSRLRRWLARTVGRGVLEIRAVRGAGYVLALNAPGSS